MPKRQRRNHQHTIAVARAERQRLIDSGYKHLTDAACLHRQVDWSTWTVDCVLAGGQKEGLPDWKPRARRKTSSDVSDVSDVSDALLLRDFAVFLSPQAIK